MDDPLQPLQDSMALLEHEIQWAHTIKNAIAEAEHLLPISDFEVAQWAIVTIDEQNLDQVLERVYKLQYFREMYNFDNITAEASSPRDLLRVWREGGELLKGYIQRQQQGHLLTIDFMPSQGHYLIVWDRAAFDPSRVQSDYDWRIYQGCTYCIFLILNSNIRAIREGVAVLLECDGMSFRNYDSQFEERRVNELFNYYPFKNKEFCFLNTPTVAIMLYKVVKPFLSKVFDQAVQLDGKIEGFDGRIDTLYNVPNFQFAQTRLLERLQEYLKERLENQMNFELPPDLNASMETSLAEDPVATVEGLVAGEE